MKLLVINIPNIDLSYFSKRGLNFEVEHKTITQKFPLKYLYNAITGTGQSVHLYTPDVLNYLETNFKEKYAGIIVGYNASDYGSEIKNTGGYTYHSPLSSGAFWCTVRDGINAFAIHELHHILCLIINIRLGDRVPKDFMDYTPVNGQWLPYYLNEQPENPESNHARTWNNIVPFLPRIEALFPKGYKYFNPVSDPKMIGIKHETMLKLDDLRERCGFPISITSGLRTKAQNDALKDSASNSGHLRGYEVDIVCTDSIKRDKIIEESYKVGFTRRGIGKDFVHLGVDPTLPKNVMWHYY